MSGMSSLVFLLVSALLLALASGQSVLQPQEFLDGMLNGDFDAVIDVRTETEWSSVGHIENATLVENLASSGTPDSIMGCQNCTIAVYCQSGNRARQAITRLLQEYNFSGPLYNGQGVSQWAAAGFDLVLTDSMPAPCADETCDSCKGDCPEPPPEDSATVLGLGAAAMLLSMGAFFY